MLVRRFLTLDNSSMCLNTYRDNVILTILFKKMSNLKRERVDEEQVPVDNEVKDWVLAFSIFGFLGCINNLLDRIFFRQTLIQMGAFFSR